MYQQLIDDLNASQDYSSVLRKQATTALVTLEDGGADIATHADHASYLGVLIALRSFSKKAARPKMTVAYVDAEVLSISMIKSDTEVAHSKEDSLYQEILQAIADHNCDKPAQCCKAALKSKQINFTRHMA